MKDRLQIIRDVKIELSRIKSNKFEEGEMENPCLDGYVAYGTKIKDGREVPNCIPDPEQMKKIVKEGFPIPSPSESETQDEYISRCISSIIDEYGQEQSAGICYSQWENK